MNRTETIGGWHAHVYFDKATVEQARAVCEAAAAQFPAEMGRMHERPVGPHPRWSCQLAFAPEVFERIVPWLALNRDGLTVFIHPETGNTVVDHAERAIWMGELLDLDIDFLRRAESS